MSAGEPPVTSKLVGSGGGIPRQRSRLWHAPGSVGEVDSLQNALEAWKVCGGTWGIVLSRGTSHRRLVNPCWSLTKCC